MVDPDKLSERLQALANYRVALERLRALSLEEYLADQVYAGRYLVQTAAQSCIDLAAHVIASEGWRAPRNFGDVFTVLAENRVIDAQLAGRLRALAGLRNRLVHVYGEIDDTLVHAALDEGLADLDAFATAIARLAL